MIPHGMAEFVGLPDVAIWSTVGAMRTETISPGDAEYADLDRRLVAANRHHVDWHTETIQVVVMSDAEEIVGGARGIVRMGAVEIRGLWLDEGLRGSGHGERIIRRLEAEARRRGARSALLDTYSFQARGFYERLGYAVFGTFAYPNGIERYYMQRAL